MDGQPKKGSYWKAEGMEKGANPGLAGGVADTGGRTQN